jgi:hypothetical protein
MERESDRFHFLSRPVKGVTAKEAAEALKSRPGVICCDEIAGCVSLDFEGTYEAFSEFCREAGAWLQNTNPTIPFEPQGFVKKRVHTKPLPDFAKRRRVYW